MERSYFIFDKRKKKEKEIVFVFCGNDRCRKPCISLDGTKGAPQEYCSKACSHRVRTRKYYQKNKKRLNKLRHKRYGK